MQHHANKERNVASQNCGLTGATTRAFSAIIIIRKIQISTFPILHCAFPKVHLPTDMYIHFLRVAFCGNWNFHSHVLLLPGASESSELSLPGTFVPWNFRSPEQKLGGIFAPHLELTL